MAWIVEADHGEVEHDGIYAQSINYPIGPRSTERLRLTPSPVHTDFDLERLVSALGKIWAELVLKPGA
jgi:5-aminolevulinate synthase